MRPSRNTPFPSRREKPMKPTPLLLAVKVAALILAALALLTAVGCRASTAGGNLGHWT